MKHRFSLNFRWIYKVNQAEAKEVAETVTDLEMTANISPSENDANLSVISDIKST